MKRNWMTYVSIIAALVAGMVCSTAFADGKGGMKFGGGSFRGASGGSSGPKMQFNGGNNVIRSGGLQSQGLGGSVKRLQGNGISGIGGQSLGNQGLKVRTMPGLPSGGNGNGNGLGIKIGDRINNPPKITINPGAGKPIVGNGQKLPIQVNPGLGKSIGGAVLGDKGIGGKVKIDPGFNVGKSIGGAVLGNKKVDPGFGVTKSINHAVLKHCIPGCNPKPCDPCHNHHNKWCGPTWWWSPCWDPCYKTCYYPTTVYAHPQTIVVPVQTVVAGAPVAPVVEEPVMQIPVGATITLQGNGLGDQLGMLVVQIDKISLPAQVNEWRPDALNVTLPMLGLAGPTKAQLWMVKADGAVAGQVAVELIPAQQQGQEVAQASAVAPIGQDAAAAALGAIE
jgi:hypothetical protein